MSSERSWHQGYCSCLWALQHRYAEPAARSKLTCCACCHRNRHVPLGKVAHCLAATLATLASDPTVAQLAMQPGSGIVNALLQLISTSDDDAFAGMLAGGACSQPSIVGHVFSPVSMLRCFYIYLTSLDTVSVCLAGSCLLLLPQPCEPSGLTKRYKLHSPNVSSPTVDDAAVMRDSRRFDSG